MEKLIELLNEYDEDWRIGRFGLYKWEEYETMEEYIISKKFGFIKWLVDNDKIDTDELLDIYWETSQSIWEDNKYELYPEYERLLMLLAISDHPIDLLIKILK